MPLYIKDGKSIFHMHVPKTGGTAIHAFFKANGFEDDFWGPINKPSNRFRRVMPQHMHAAHITSLFRPARFDMMFITVRNPLARLVSEYKMRVRDGVKADNIERWFDRVTKVYLEDPYMNDNHIRPQSDFWLPSCYVFKQEDGYDDALVKTIGETLGLGFPVKKMAARNITSTQKLDPAAIERIAPRVKDFYREDYVKFGYD